MRKRLVTTARQAVRKSWLERGAAEAELGWTDRILDPNVLTVGFARRVSTYKRLTLMLQDAERLREILCNEERPVQFIIAGKAHPADGGGKHLLQQLVQFADEAGVRDRIVFLPDYDIELAQVMISGCDVWLNNPIRPQEASGTSGMKVVMNGGLTLSVSDGWWDEMADDSLGWTIPSVSDVDDATRDRLESLALYDLLEQNVAPLFYDRDAENLPRGWVDLMRRSLVQLAPQVSATRMVRDYVDQYYRPALFTSLLMDDDKKASTDFVAWLNKLRREWFKVSITSLTCNSHSALADEAFVTECSSVAAGEKVAISAEVELGDLHHSDVAVQVLYGPVNEQGDIEDAKLATLTAGAGKEFHTELTVDVPGELGITARVVPNHKLIVNPAETGLCVWA